MMDTMIDVPTLNGSMTDIKNVTSNPKLVVDGATVVLSDNRDLAEFALGDLGPRSGLWSVDELGIHRIDSWKFMSVGDPLHRYEIHQTNGQVVGYIEEKPGKKLTRLFKGGERDCELEVSDSTRQVVMVAKKSKPGVSVSVIDETGSAITIGSVRKQWKALTRNFFLEHEGEDFGKVVTKNTSDVYVVTDVNLGHKLAEVGAVPTEKFLSNQVSYRVRFEPGVVFSQRAVVLGLLLGLDFEYYTAKD